MATNPTGYSNKTMMPFTRVTGQQSKPSAKVTVDSLGDGLKRGVQTGNPALSGTSKVAVGVSTPHKSMF